MPITRGKDVSHGEVHSGRVWGKGIVNASVSGRTAEPAIRRLRMHLTVFLNLEASRQPPSVLRSNAHKSSLLLCSHVPTTAESF